MSARICYIAVVTLFAVTSVLAEPKKCYSCFGVTSKECADLTESEMDANKPKYQIPCPPKTADVQTIINQLSASSQTDDASGKVLKALGEKLSAEKANTDFEWSCIKAIFTSDLAEDADFAFRGCWPDEILDRDGCDYAEHAVGLLAGDLDYCGTCSDDLCNSAISISHMSLLTVVFITLFKMLF